MSKERQAPAFLTMVGSSTYALVKSLLTPKKPQECDLKTLIKTLTDHFSPKPTEIVQRFKFHECYQGDESISVYLSKLKKLSENCNFDATLNERLRD